MSYPPYSSIFNHPEYIRRVQTKKVLLVKPFPLRILIPFYLRRGFDSRYFHSFKCGLNLERGPLFLVRAIGQLLDSEVLVLIKKVDINRPRSVILYKIILSYCHLLTSYRSLVDRSGSLHVCIYFAVLPKNNFPLIMF